MASKTSFVLVGVASFVWSAQTLAERGFTAEFVSGESRPRSIALLPVESTVVRARVIEVEGLVDESIVYGEMFNEQVETLMGAKGYTVRIVTPDLINADPRLQEYVVDANRAFDQMMMQYRPKRVEKRIYNAGDSVKLLAGQLGVDAIAFSTLNITITPAGKAIMSALVGGTTAGTNASLMLVDGDTADLEAVFWGINFVTPGEKTDDEMQQQVVKVAEHTLKRLPGADPSSRMDAAPDDDEALLEIESLLNE